MREFTPLAVGPTTMARGNAPTGQGPPKKKVSPRGKPVRARRVSRARTETLAVATSTQKSWLGRWRSSCAVGDHRSSAKNLALLVKRELICQWAAIAIGLAVVFPALMMVMDRRPVVELINPRITPDPVVPGAPFYLTWKVIEHCDCTGAVERTIIDASGRKFPFQRERTAYHSATSKDTMEFSKELIAPLGLTFNSVATYHAVVERWCNQLQKWIWPMREEVTIRFNVGPKAAR